MVTQTRNVLERYRNAAALTYPMPAVPSTAPGLAAAECCAVGVGQVIDEDAVADQLGAAVDDQLAGNT